ncbi:hypothetical protein VNO78_12407 [Psophocarpus tetragonolobus]
MEKLTQLHFYFHDHIKGKNPTSLIIVQPPTRFGTLYIMDDFLTEGPSPSSKLVGRSQGMYATSSQHGFDFFMATSFLFTEGIYNGSTLSIVGRNADMPTREIPIVGGTGVFRYARGSAWLTTYMFNVTSGVAIVEYNVSVVHV